jgi:hypothetical protein
MTMCSNTLAPVECYNAVAIDLLGGRHALPWGPRLASVSMTFRIQLYDFNYP